MSFSYDDYDHLEIVGFDGSTRIACSAFLPIVRDKRTDRFHKLSPRWEQGSPAAAYSGEIADLSADTIITLLPTPRPAFAFAMIVWVSDEALRIADVKPPDDLDWQNVGVTGQAGIGVDEKSFEFLHQLARALMDRATDHLIDFFAHRHESNCTRAKEIIRIARAATASTPKPGSDYSLRAQIILRYALALKYSSTPERLDNVFELRIRREFPEWDWESFQTRVTRLSELLHDQAFTRRIGSQDTVSLGYMALIISKSVSRVKLVDGQQRISRCEELAQDFRDSYESSPEEILAVAEIVNNQSSIVLNYRELKVFGGEPIFYYLCSKQEINLAPKGRTPVLSTLDFQECATEFTEAGGNGGQLAETLERDLMVI